ncbi:Retrovirus-related Pol polyprotein from transposon RE2, partial [Linum grandiflorum]
MQQLWTEQDLLDTSRLSAEVSSEIQKERKRSRILQFLMKLRPEFETARSQLISANTTDIDTVLGDLLRVETRLKTQNLIDHPSSDLAGTVFAASRFHQSSQSRPRFNSTPGDVHCRHCNESGHSQSHCRKRNFCNYCKRSGHIILDCRSRVRNEAFKRNLGSGSNSSTGPSKQNFGSPTSATSAFHTQLVDSTVSSVAAPTTNIDQLVQEALARALPTAIHSAFASLGVTGKPSTWFLDSASFNHMTGNGSLFETYSPVKHLSVEVANGNKLVVAGVGDIKLPNMDLRHTLHVPSLVPNLISVGQLTDNGCLVSFSPTGCSIQDLKTRNLIGKGSKAGRNFFLTSLVDPTAVSINDGSSILSSFSVQSHHRIWELWHSRLGHPHSIRLKYMFQNKLLPTEISLNNSNLLHLPCVPCIGAKTSKFSFGSSSTVIEKPFDLVHSDLWGPSPVSSRLGYRYFALFIDHATRHTW